MQVERSVKIDEGTIIMRNKILAVSALLLTSVATPALAQDEASDITISGGATVVSDYRFRGISQTDKNFAVQGTVTVSHKSGLYASIWGSSIDDYVANGSDQEIDLIAGFKTPIGPVTVDAGVLYYFYPGSNKNLDLIRLAAFPFPVAKYKSDFVEPYLSVSGAIGPVTAKVTANYAPKQGALGYAPYTGTFTNTFLGAPFIKTKADNLYTALDLSATVPSTPVSLSAHVGHNWMKSFLSGQRKYTDWGVGVSYAYKNLTFGVNYVGTDIPERWAPTIAGVSQEAKDGVVASIGVSF